MYPFQNSVFRLHFMTCAIYQKIIQIIKVLSELNLTHIRHSPDICGLYNSEFLELLHCIMLSKTVIKTMTTSPLDNV